MKVAVLGTGSAGSRHLSAIRSLEGIDPIAIPYRTGRRAELEAEGFTTVEDLSAAVSEGATAVIIASDTAKHVEDAISAMEFGLDVLVEKPAAVDALEANRITQRASQLNRRIHVACVLRFSDSLNTFRKLLPELGPVHSVHVECRSYLPDWRPNRPYKDTYSARALEGGVMRDLIHEIDYAGWLFGWPTSMQARLRNTGHLNIDSEELADLTWHISGGPFVSVHLDYLSKPPRRTMTAFGEAGTITWDGIAGNVIWLKGNEPASEWKCPQTADQLFYSQADAFTQAICGIVDERLANGCDGVRALAICDTARKADASNREEQVKYP
jgi:predicted dehydrogenase